MIFLGVSSSMVERNQETTLSTQHHTSAGLNDPCDKSSLVAGTLPAFVVFAIDCFTMQKSWEEGFGKILLLPIILFESL